jgi:hypothetical protein
MSVWSSIATTIMTFANCDKCLRQGRIFDDYNAPSVNEVRAFFQKHKPVRSISLKKALRIISVMTVSHQPHWICAPLYASCVESGSPMFWTEQSMSRLINLILNYVQSPLVDPTNAPPSAQGDNNTRIGSHSHNNNNKRELGSPTSLGSYDPHGDHTTTAHGAHTHEASTATVTVPHMSLSMSLGVGVGNGSPNSRSSPGLPSSATVYSGSVAASLGHISSNGVHIPAHSNPLELGRSTKMKCLSLCAKGFWKAKVVDPTKLSTRSSVPATSRTHRDDSNEHHFQPLVGISADSLDLSALGQQGGYDVMGGMTARSARSRPSSGKLSARQQGVDHNAGHHSEATSLSGGDSASLARRTTLMNTQVNAQQANSKTTARDVVAASGRKLSPNCMRMSGRNSPSHNTSQRSLSPLDVPTHRSSMRSLSRSSSGTGFAAAQLGASSFGGYLPVGTISPDNLVRDIDIEQAILEYGDYGFTITAAELALLCIEAWEEEFLYVRYCIERAQVSKHRRPAVCGTFNVNFEVNAEYRLAVERIIDWYAKNGYKGEVTACVVLLEFCDDVVPTMCCRSGLGRC